MTETKDERKTTENQEFDPTPPKPVSDILVYDIEIPKEVKDTPGGWDNPHGMGFGTAVVYSYLDDIYHFFSEVTKGPGFDECLAMLRKPDAVVVGFNSVRFDNSIMLGNEYWKQEHQGWRNYDLLLETIYSKFDVKSYEEAVKKAGKFGKTGIHNGSINLDSITEATFGLKKTGHGAHAPVMIKEGRHHEVLAYNLHDVRLTRKFLEWAEEHGQIEDGQGNVIKINVPKDMRTFMDEHMDYLIR